MKASPAAHLCYICHLHRSKNMFMTQEISINRAKIFCKISNDINKEVTPDLVLIPASSDTHQAHRVIHEEAKRIFKNTSL